MKTIFPVLCLSSLAVSVALITGCGSSATSAPIVSGNVSQPVLVKAGALPVIGASVQIYAAGTAGNGSAGTLLTSNAGTTSSTGTLTLTFTCPSSSSLLYAIATGGSTTSSGPANAATALGAVLGPCSAAGTTSALVIDEATTVAMAYGMSQFLSTGGKLGATSTNASGIALATATVANLVNTTTGIAPGPNFPATGTSPAPKLNTVANLLNACISGGATSSSCTQLFAATTRAGVTPSNTLDAAINLAKQPGVNVATLYALASGITPYAPTLTAQPADWTLYATFGGGGLNDPSALSIDSAGNIWVASYFGAASLFTNTGLPVSTSGFTDSNLNSSYGGAVDSNDNFWQTNEESNGSYDGGLGSVTVFNKSGSQGTFGGGGLNFPLAAAFDSSGNAWEVDYGDSSVSKFSASKSTLAGSSGYQSSSLIFPVAVAVDASGNAWVANQSSNTVTRVASNGSTFTSFVVGNGPSGIAVDAAGNVWSANYYGDSVGLIAGGTTVTSGSGFTGGGVNHPQGIAADGNGTIWVANYRGLGITELAGASTSSPGAALSPTSGWAADAGLLEPFALAIDAAGNIWVSNFGSNTITEFIGAAAPVKTPLLGNVRVP